KLLSDMALKVTNIRVGNRSRAGGFAQHYGFPTRYVDLTSDPTVALHFAASTTNERPPKQRVVWRLDLQGIDKKTYVEGGCRCEPLRRRSGTPDCSTPRTALFHPRATPAGLGDLSANRRIPLQSSALVAPLAPCEEVHRRLSGRRSVSTPGSRKRRGRPLCTLATRDRKGAQGRSGRRTSASIGGLDLRQNPLVRVDARRRVLRWDGPWHVGALLFPRLKRRSRTVGTIVRIARQSSRHSYGGRSGCPRASCSASRAGAYQTP